MKIGILGSGFMGGTHARAYAKIPGVKVVAVSSRTSKRRRSSPRKSGSRHHRRSLDHRGSLDRHHQQHAADASSPRDDDRGIESWQACPPRKALRADGQGLRRHDRGGEGDRPHPHGRACAALLAGICIVGRVRRKRQARQTDFGRGDTIVAIAGLGRLVSRSGTSRRRGPRSLRA